MLFFSSFLLLGNVRIEEIEQKIFWGWRKDRWNDAQIIFRAKCGRTCGAIEKTPRKGEIFVDMSMSSLLSFCAFNSVFSTLFMNSFTFHISFEKTRGILKHEQPNFLMCQKQQTKLLKEPISSVGYWFIILSDKIKFHLESVPRWYFVEYTIVEY